MNKTLQAGSKAANALSTTLTQSSDSNMQLESGLTQPNTALRQIKKGIVTLLNATASAGNGIS